jgi:hypothetical protein
VDAVFATQMVLTGALQHGFLENPYRSVVIAPPARTHWKSPR